MGSLSMLLAVLCCVVSSVWWTAAETLSVGNSSGWALGITYAPLTVELDDSLVFLGCVVDAKPQKNKLACPVRPSYVSPLDVLPWQVFKYERGQHNVVQIDSAECSALAQGNVLAGLAQNTYTYVATTPGTKYFACSVPGGSRFLFDLARVLGLSAKLPKKICLVKFSDSQRRRFRQGTVARECC